MVETKPFERAPNFLRVDANASARGFLAFPGFTQNLTDELRDRFAVTPADFARAETHGDLLFFPSLSRGTIAPWWAATTMERPFFLTFDAISGAAAGLRSVQRNWAPAFCRLYRRGELVQGKLPHVNFAPRTGPCCIPASPMGLYTLLDERRILASGKTLSALPAGRLVFAEDHENPPSRAYLKLWEALTLQRGAGVPLPAPGCRCLDAGASPGGWTWALAKLGANVLAVDRAELDPRLMSHPAVTFRSHDAFTLPPADLGPFDWVFSDVICYPGRLLEWVASWVESGLAAHIVATIKMQGPPDWPLLERFAAIPGSLVRHLNYNTHELCWLWSAPSKV
jgi:23S rRNA (cytidine2498-2'-O)-methyltransferase